MLHSSPFEKPRRAPRRSLGLADPSLEVGKSRSPVFQGSDADRREVFLAPQKLEPQLGAVLHGVLPSVPFVDVALAVLCVVNGEGTTVFGPTHRALACPMHLLVAKAVRSRGRACHAELGSDYRLGAWKMHALAAEGAGARGRCVSVSRRAISATVRRSCRPRLPPFLAFLAPLLGLFPPQCFRVAVVAILRSGAAMRDIDGSAGLLVGDQRHGLPHINVLAVRSEP